MTDVRREQILLYNYIALQAGQMTKQTHTHGLKGFHFLLFSFPFLSQHQGHKPCQWKVKRKSYKYQSAIKTAGVS